MIRQKRRRTGAVDAFDFSHCEPYFKRARHLLYPSRPVCVFALEGATAYLALNPIATTADTVAAEELGCEFTYSTQTSLPPCS